MNIEPSALANWTPEQIALGKRWVETWRLAGADLERIHRKELRNLVTYRAIELLCGPADYTWPRRAPKTVFRTGRTTTMVDEGGWP